MAEEIIRIYPNDNMSFNIDNLSEDKNAQDFVEFELDLQKEGEPLETEKFDLDIEPGKNYWYFLEPEELKDGEYIYNITAKAKKAVGDYKKGQELAHTQKIFKVEGNPEEVEEKELPELKVEQTDEDVIFTGENFEAKFSRPLGGLVKLVYDGVDYLNSKPLITFWRPLTDTDLHLGYNFESALWLAATVGQQLLPEKYYFEQVGDDYKLTFVYRYPLPGGQESAVIYTVKPDGTIQVETVYSGLATVDTMPVFGMDFKLNKNLDAFKYYGYGPEENYIDTTEGLDLGVYESTVRKNYNKKIRPQENGNRTGVRWAEVYNSKTGKGIKFTAVKNNFEFNVLPYNTYEIEAASDASELGKINNTNVRIAGRVSGVGNGDYIDNWARVDAGEMIELIFDISPVTVFKETKKATPKKTEPKKAEAKKETSKVETKKEPTKKETKKETKTDTKEAKTKTTK